MEYHKILENILGRKEYLIVGKSVVRADALDKALGLARYTADYIQDNTVVLKIVRSTEPHALIKNLNIEVAKKIPGVLDIIEDTRSSRYYMWCRRTGGESDWLCLT